jgi:hypothetical protein
VDALRLVGVVCTDVEELDVGSSRIVAELLSVRGKGVEVVEMEGSEAEVGFDEELPGDDRDDAGGACVVSWVEDELVDVAEDWVSITATERGLE